VRAQVDARPLRGEYARPVSAGATTQKPPLPEPLTKSAMNPRRLRRIKTQSKQAESASRGQSRRLVRHELYGGCASHSSRRFGPLPGKSSRGLPGKPSDDLRHHVLKTARDENIEQSRGLIGSILEIVRDAGGNK
jgi:hypothetical protein